MPERALARIDLAAVERNCALLAGRLSGRARLCAVVKADGYGHGAAVCAEAALRGGASWLAVATAAEAGSLPVDRAGRAASSLMRRHRRVVTLASVLAVAATAWRGALWLVAHPFGF